VFWLDTRISLCAVPPLLVPFRLPGQRPEKLHAHRCTPARSKPAPARSAAGRQMPIGKTSCCRLHLDEEAGAKAMLLPSRTLAASLWHPRRDAPPSRGGSCVLPGGGPVEWW